MTDENYITVKTTSVINDRAKENNVIISEILKCHLVVLRSPPSGDMSRRMDLSVCEWDRLNSNKSIFGVYQTSYKIANKLYLI